MNIGLISDLAETGFGRVGRELARRFLEAGHDVRILAINFEGREGAVKRLFSKREVTGDEVKDAFDRIANDPVLSNAIPAHIGGDGMGHNLTAPFVEGGLIDGWKPHRVLLVADPVASMYRQMYDDGALSKVPTYNYVPIEGSDLSVFWRTIYEVVQPVAMTRFGQRELGRMLGRGDVPYIPHGISDTFYRITPERPGFAVDGEITSKEQAKAHFGWDGRTVILRYDRYVARKGYPEYFEVIRRVISERDDVVFVIHCAPNDEGGVMTQLLADLPGAYEANGWRHSQVVLTRAHDTFRGLSDAQLNLLVNAADIYASTTYSEGWGLTLAEAAACGVPVVATDFGAIPEAVGLGGILVPPMGVIPTTHGHKWAVVDIDAMTDAVLYLVDDKDAREDLGKKGENHVGQFDWDVTALSFLRLMEGPFAWRR